LSRPPARPAAQAVNAAGASHGGLPAAGVTGLTKVFSFTCPAPCSAREINQTLLGRRGNPEWTSKIGNKPFYYDTAVVDGTTYIRVYVK